VLIIDVPAGSLWDEKNEEFIIFKGESLMLEHSLVSLSKWEQSSEKPFLGKEEKTTEETIDYIKVMTISPVNDPNVYLNLSSENFKEISEYIGRKMTATIFNETPGSKSSGEFITAEIIYFWMIGLQVPFEAQYWHLNQLLTLVKVINLKNQPAKPQGRQTTAQQRRALNDQRLAQMKTTG
jgi:hypothetical protein